ncbi:MAG: hypothetical protein AAGF11_07560 [Myxococcota bacterium]
MRRIHLALALLLLTPFGCKNNDPQADGRRITAESDYDATQPIVHEGFRFRLGSPGEGWKLMRKQDIRRMVPDAVAGATSRDGVFGGVIVERLPGIDLDKAEELVSASLPNAVQESTEDIELGGLTARKTVFTAAMEGVEFRYARVLFLREGYLYQLLAWGLKASTPATALQPFFDAFSLTEGEIHGEADDRPPVEHADGVTWQIRDGRFASIVSGLQLPAVDSWRFLVGQELVQTNAEAELALTNDKVSGYVAVISERYDGGDPSGMVAAIRAGLAQNLGPGTEVPSRTIAGKEVPFLRYQTQAALEFEVGVMTGEGAVTQVMTWYPQALRDAALPAFEAVAGKMTLASKAERATLREQLLAREGVVWKVGAKSAFLGKTFRDFEHQITWTQPRGLYEVRVGDEAKTQVASAVLAFQGPLLAVYGHVEVIEGGAARTAELHEAVASTLDGRRDEPGVVDGTTVQRSFGTDRMNDVEFRYGVLSASHQGNAIVMTAWGPAASSVVAPAIEGVLGGLGLPAALPDFVIEGGRFVDHQHGVSVAEPGSGWVRSDETPAGTPIGRFTQWKKGSGEMALITVAAQGFSDDEEWMASFAEQTMRDQLALKAPLGKPESTQSTLHGHPSRRLVYSEAQIEVAVRNSVLYMLVMANVGAAEAERFRGSLRWAG